MKHLKLFEQFKLNELINTRDELVNVPKSEIRDFIEPALMTSEEYIKFVNSKNEWHDNDSYDYTLAGGSGQYGYDNIKKSKLVKQKQIGKVNLDFYLLKEASTFGYYENPEEEDYSKKKWKHYSDEEKTGKGLPLFSYEIKVLHKEEDIIVGSAQDEWGCVLIWVFDEYRGMGIGEEIVKLYREYYPSKTSGGFTSFGYNQAKKYHAHLVRKYLSNGIYSDMVKKGEIESSRVKDIIQSIKDIKRFSKSKESTNPLVKHYGESGKYGVNNGLKV